MHQFLDSYISDIHDFIKNYQQGNGWNRCFHPSILINTVIFKMCVYAHRNGTAIIYIFITP